MPTMPSWLPKNALFKPVHRYRREPTRKITIWKSTYYAITSRSLILTLRLYSPVFSFLPLVFSSNPTHWVVELQGTRGHHISTRDRLCYGNSQSGLTSLTLAQGNDVDVWDDSTVLGSNKEKETKKKTKMWTTAPPYWFHKILLYSTDITATNNDTQR